MDKIERLEKALEIFAQKLDFQNKIQKQQIEIIQRLCNTLKETLKVYEENNKLLQQLLGKSEVPKYIAWGGKNEN